LQFDSLTVADSAFYTQDNLQITKEVKWLSRVPLTVKAAKNLVESGEESELTASHIPGYRFQEYRQNYAAIEQRWLLVESQKRKESDLKTLLKKIQKDGETAQQKLRELSEREFACAADAQKAASRLLRKSKYHQLTNLEITEDAGVYQVKATVTIDEVSVELKKRSAGRFILATNVLNHKELTSESMLSNYKEQQAVERGFGFLKDPLFLTDSVFLKSPQRIEALGFIMGLCLLVYTRSSTTTSENFEPAKNWRQKSVRSSDQPTDLEMDISLFSRDSRLQESGS
jgi:transposase